jgi:hypothetical protein
MVMAGQRKRNNEGARLNKPSTLAYPFSSTLYSPGITHKNNPLIIRKIPRIM